MRKNLNGLFTCPDIPYSKETSLYYELLVNQYGKEFAEQCWQKRLQLEKTRDEEAEWSITWKKVRDYQPKDPLCLIGDLNWGYNNITNENSLNKPKN